ncbi:MAG: c-type cytochrome [Alphaproteobacteria bacterium]|nr:c-type cytochrome [Alphaproteobacteria bacterium]
MPTHILRLLLLIIGFFILAIAAVIVLTPESFYEFGHYRADSVGEIAADIPKFQGPDYCEACHEEQHADWSAGIHTVVKCEVCHGAAGEHPLDGGKLPIPTDSVKLCTLCHEKMPARPAAQPQIVVSEHAGDEQCVTCHDPHSPALGDSGSGQAGADPGPASQCAGCHGAEGLGVGDFPPLAGKAADYLATQLQDYRSGAREDPMMNTIAESLSDADIAELAAYYASFDGRSAQ